MTGPEAAPFCPGHDARYHAAQRKLNRHAGEIVRYFAEADKGFSRNQYEWLFRAACRWAGYTGPCETYYHACDAARLLSVYFTERPGHSARDGWTITDSPAVMRSTILRACS